MFQKDDLGRLLDYSVWANHRIMRPVATLPTADFKKDMKFSHGGLRGTLTHIMWAEWLWLERWKGLSPRLVIDESEFPDVVALRDRWTTLEKHREAWFEALRPPEVNELVRYRSTAGTNYEAPLWQLVQSLANHSTYHRGQVTSMLRLLGVRTVATDMMVWDRDAKARAARRREA